MFVFLVVFYVLLVVSERVFLLINIYTVIKFSSKNEMSVSASKKHRSNVEIFWKSWNWQKTKWPNCPFLVFYFFRCVLVLLLRIWAGVVIIKLLCGIWHPTPVIRTSYFDPEAHPELKNHPNLPEFRSRRIFLRNLIFRSGQKSYPDILYQEIS